MAGYRQGLALLHLEGRNAVEDGGRGLSCSARKQAQRRRGRKFPAAVAAKRKRRSRALPTKAIDEAVGERGFRASFARTFGKDRLARSMSSGPSMRATLIAWAC
jgi:hypothetical protein